MNFYRRILMAPGSLHHWKKVVTAPPPSTGVQNYRIWKWKVACSSPAAAPFSTCVETSEATPPIKADLCDGASSSAEKTKVASNTEKRKIFQKLKSLTVKTVELIIREDQKKGLFVSQGVLIEWVELLTYKYRKPENALEIFRWMDSKEVVFSPSQFELYVDLIAKVDGLEAARKFFNKVDPEFDNFDRKAENRPVYLKLYPSTQVSDEEDFSDEEEEEEEEEEVPQSNSHLMRKRSNITEREKWQMVRGTVRPI